jgi:hypothetical protein
VAGLPELIDLVHDADPWRPFGGWDHGREGRMAETGRGNARFGDFDIDKVPQPCPFVADPGRVAVAVSIFVGPRRLTRDVVRGQRVGICREQHPHLRTCCRVEVVLGDQCNDFGTLVAPSERGVRCGCDDREKDAGGKYALGESPNGHQAPIATGSIRLASLFLTFPTRVCNRQPTRAEQHV